MTNAEKSLMRRFIKWRIRQNRKKVLRYENLVGEWCLLRDRIEVHHSTQKGTT